MPRLWIATLTAALAAVLFYGAGCSGRSLDGGGAGGGDGGTNDVCGARSIANCSEDTRCVIVQSCCGANQPLCVPTGTTGPVCHCPSDGCSGLDEISCGENPTCRADYCYECSCTPSFVGCTRATDSPTMCPGLGCAQPACSCDGMPESACISSESSLGCSPLYCPDCNGGEHFTQCMGPDEGGACPGDCPVMMQCRTSADCSNGGVCLAPPTAGACPAECVAEKGCDHDRDCGSGMVCDYDPCACPLNSSVNTCVSKCTAGGCALGESCGSDGHCAPTPCKSDNDCNPPCRGGTNCLIQFCVNNQCYPSLGTCEPPPV